MKTSKISTAIIQIFNGLSGILGGFMLIKDPSGVSLEMDLEWLQSTPFQNFLIPGIVLFVINGLGNVTGFAVTLSNSKNAGKLALALGAIMMIWIISQVSWIGYKNYLQPLYFFTGLLQLIAGYYLNKQIRRNETIK
jgi:hypothetical protein